MIFYNKKTTVLYKNTTEYEWYQQ